MHRLGCGVATADNAKVTTVAGRLESQAARVIRLEVENARLTVEARKLATGRDILRRAAKYFAEDTNW